MCGDRAGELELELGSFEIESIVHHGVWDFECDGVAFGFYVAEEGNGFCFPNGEVDCAVSDGFFQHKA